MNRSPFFFLVGTAGLALSLIYTAPVGAVPTFTVTPSFTGPLLAGATFTVDVTLSGLGSEVGVNDFVSAYDLLLGYDSSFLSANSVTFGAALGTGALDPPDDTDGEYFVTGQQTDYVVPASYNGPHGADLAVDFGQSSVLCGFVGDTCPLAPSGSTTYLMALQPSGVVLATFSFTVNDPQQRGITWLTLIDNTMIPDSDEQFFDVKGNDRESPTGIAIGLANGQVEVPEPGTLALLLGAGLFGGGRKALRRRRASA
ncbi:PEP-CTERM sorting domain-containing protein [Candidatus Thiodictyon syntrophicum]|jgi:hypothetical protein|uniref:Ice-binding protein C-terminal domain-containing protein n=1 Tax=Candidatus Thiodictyon syntrophicum TaxID=1166950 RepID=A0A2K8U5U8_9GAMM|nr:PEP-CTERM sorting domain-containing protein [Candidatus Thiodictyon syntrophicum]AUB80953.1 hypothetical protein THSYN_08330 [Candidatus Thiodictyon syntrophicum]